MAIGDSAANPTGPGVARGAALISNPSSNILQVVNTPGTIINWQGFSIGAGEITRFLQQDRASAILNRVGGTQRSDIFGRLESNGRVFLINPNGIVFGAGSAVDVAGLIASTRDISDANFAAGNLQFQGVAPNSIDVQNGALITTSNAGAGGQVWLFAKNVNLAAGSQLNSSQGQVVIAAGTDLQVGNSTLGNMTFNVTTDGANNISSLGTIAAERGAVGMFADSITHGGTINAQSDGGARGKVLMSATKDITIQGGATINTDALASGQGGIVDLRAGRRLEINPAATVSADGGPAGGDGGSIALSANDIDLGPLAYLSLNVHATTRMAGYREGSVTLAQPAPTYAAQGGTLPLAGADVIIGLADGGFVAVWTDCGGCNEPKIMMQAFSSSGVARSAPVAVATSEQRSFSVPGSPPDPECHGSNCGGGPGVETNTFRPALGYVSPLRDGGFVVFWSKSGLEPGMGVNSELYVQRFDSSAGAMGSRISIDRINARVPGFASAGATDVTGTASGGFVIAWQETVAGVAQSNGTVLSDTRFYSRAYDANGAPLAGPIDPNPIGIRPAPGGFAAFGAGHSVQRYDARGLPLGSPGPVIGDCAGTAGTSCAQSAVSGVGGFTIHLINFGAGGWASGWTVSGRQYDFNGNPLGQPVDVPQYGAGIAFPPQLAPLSNGNAIGPVAGGFQQFSPGGGAVGQLISAPGYPLIAGLARGAFVAADGGTAQIFVPTPAPFVSGTLASGEIRGTTPLPPQVLLPENPAPASPTSPNAPNIVFGNPNGGATFGGVSGCNAQVCSDEMKAAISMIGAERALAQRAAGGSDQEILDRTAREAVLALQAAAEARRQISGANDLEMGVTLKDYGEMDRLSSIAAAAIKKAVDEGRPADAVKTAAGIKAIIQDFQRRELALQALGAYRTDPTEMTIVDSVSNMSDEQQRLFMNSVFSQMQQGL